MKIPIFLTALSVLLVFSACEDRENIDDIFSYAKTRQKDLRLSVYITAHTVDRLLSTEAGKREAVSIMRCNGMTKVYLEVYRSGLVVPVELLKSLTEFFETQGFEVVGGIATVPGVEFGVRQEGPLGWFNWQNEKTQKDLREVMTTVAPVFDTFIVDDFLCTGDTSVESKNAKGDRSWSEYRMDLLSELSESVFIGPAKSVNPDLEMIIKYPQWYDRFHMFGYDVEREPKLYDRVWVGTETRGQFTQRFGFVQPYEGFVNYRWLAGIAGDKIGGAWFDHGDCDPQDFVEQAYQTVLAGAKEIVLFNYASFVGGHGGHHLLRTEFEMLADLAAAVAKSPVQGPKSYKPPHSDPGGDLYIMDYIGMFGVPLVPVSKYPEDADVLFLPTQAASDPEILEKITQSLQSGTRLIMTTGFLAKAIGGNEIAKLAGVEPVESLLPVSAGSVMSEGVNRTLDIPLDLAAELNANEAEVILEVLVNDRSIPFLTRSISGQIFVLNSRTFSQKDFDAVGEVLLCPKELGLLEVPDDWANAIRHSFLDGSPLSIDAPTRVTYQPLENGSFVMHNYNREEISVMLKGKIARAYTDAMTGKKIDVNAEGISVTMAPRSRSWFQLRD